jgi:type VI protein secretion system component VasK
LHDRFFHRLPKNEGQGIADEEILQRRKRRVWHVILVCWAVILVKSVAVVWAVGQYKLPFNPLWVIGPTVTFAALATIVFLAWRDE